MPRQPDDFSVNFDRAVADVTAELGSVNANRIQKWFYANTKTKPNYRTLQQGLADRGLKTDGRKPQPVPSKQLTIAQCQQTPESQLADALSIAHRVMQSTRAQTITIRRDGKVTIAQEESYDLA